MATGEGLAMLSSGPMGSALALASPQEQPLQVSFNSILSCALLQGFASF